MVFPEYLKHLKLVFKTNIFQKQMGIYMLGLKNTGDGSQPMESPNINMAGIDGCSSPT
jgi:hypothetical protein